MRFRKKVYESIEPNFSDKVIARWIEYLLVVLVFLNIMVILLETVKDINEQYAHDFHAFEIFSVIVFSIEYILRLWTCKENPKYNKGTGRLQYALTTMSLIDLLSILPFYLSSLLPFNLLFLRIIRLFRLFRLLKIARYLTALNLIGAVLRERREQLLLSFMFILFLLVIVSTLMFHVEHNAQPELFSSIPATMWWGITTLTTVGYGDMIPITTGGRVLGGMIAIIGVGLFALPAGILSSGLTEHLRRHKESRAHLKTKKCPHCGGELHD